jgi:hypothetical protein
MGSYPANRIEWPHMSNMDNYINARANVQKIAARIIALKEELNTFVTKLSNPPATAIQWIPKTWPSRDELESIMRDAVDAFREMSNRWDDLPDDLKGHAQPPIPNLLPQSDILDSR